jgi:hypothetical protein
LGNPFSTALPPDGKRHVVKITAPGYVASESDFVCDQDISLKINLQPESRYVYVAAPRPPPPLPSQNMPPPPATATAVPKPMQETDLIGGRE